jgi:hypothetical protein
MAQSIMLIKKAAKASAIPIWDSVAGTLRRRIALSKRFLLTRAHTNQFQPAYMSQVASAGLIPESLHYVDTLASAGPWHRKLFAIGKSISERELVLLRGFCAMEEGAEECTKVFSNYHQWGNGFFKRKY